MNTKLLIAASATALLGFAGAASAIDLSLAHTKGLANDGIESSRVIASEVVPQLFASPLIADLEMVLAPSASAILPSGNAILTVSVTGGSIVTSGGGAVTAGAIIHNGACAPTRSIVSSSASSVTFLVSNMGGCSNAVPFHLAVPVVITAANTVSASVVFETEGGTAIDGGTAAVTALSYASGYAVSVGAGLDSPIADVTNSFDTLDISPAQLGVVNYSLPLYSGNPAVTNVIGAAVPAALGHFGSTVVTVTATSGSFAGLTANVEAEAPAGVFSSGDTVYTATTTADIGGTGNSITVTDGGTGPIGGGTFSAAATSTLTIPGVANPIPKSGSGTINSVTLGGTNFVAPWVPFANATPTGFIRLSNASSTASGPISLTLLAWSNGTPISTTCTLPDVVNGNSVLTINGAMLRNCFGTGINNGDIRVTIQSNATNLNAKLRVQDGSGDTFEQSLGTLTSYNDGVIQ